MKVIRKQFLCKVMRNNNKRAFASDFGVSAGRCFFCQKHWMNN